MDFNVGFDDDAIRKLANELVGGEQETSQRMLDGVLEEYQGHPVDEVAAVLKARWEAAGDGASIDGEELQDWASLLSAGTPIVLRRQEEPGGSAS